MSATTMSRTAAIRRAKSEVAFVRAATGDRVNVYDHGYGAWVEGRTTYYEQAREWYKVEVVSKALALLGWEPWDVEEAVRAGEWRGKRVEEIVREITEEA